jgi:hypothetical protein
MPAKRGHGPLLHYLFTRMEGLHHKSQAIKNPH